MKALKLAAVVLLSLGSVAMARPSTWKMTCNEAKSLVAQNPGVVMNYGYSASAGYLYDRFFPNERYCERHHDDLSYARLIVTQTTDTSRCRVGYICN